MNSCVNTDLIPRCMYICPLGRRPLCSSHVSFYGAVGRTAVGLIDYCRVQQIGLDVPDPHECAVRRSVRH